MLRGNGFLIDAGMTVITIADLLSPDDVLLDVEATTKHDVFEQVGTLLRQRHDLDREVICNNLHARERLGSTALGHGVSIPHARLKRLSKALAAFVRTRRPIPFEAPDGKPVSDMIVLIVPERATDLHLQLLASMAQMFADKTFRQKLAKCDDAVAVHRLIATQARQC